MESDLPSIARKSCDSCLGRIFSNVSTGMTNGQRGAIVRSVLLKEQKDAGFQGDCDICGNILSTLDHYAEICVEKLREYSFNTFRIGSIFDETTIRREAQLHESLGVEAESLKKEFNRELGKILEGIAEFDSADPQIEITVDTRYDVVTIRSESVFAHGTYRKAVRGIPQTRWIHGSGDTVESIIGEPAKAMLQGENYYLHGAGREDVDVRMLGNGREFIIEISQPKKRCLNLAQLRREVNRSGKVTIRDLKIASKKDVATLKLSKHSKTYRVRVDCKEELDKNKLNLVLSDLNGKIIYQRTPLRVSRRRADLIRERHLLNTEVKSCGKHSAVIELTAEAGTYIKELVSGDRGRTNPSISSLYGVPIGVRSLDVTWIHR